ncbi:MAG: hypothetical protein MMC33_000108 [Icmadophila ericetorum]|nr:hypothetical protein [Icmadophila ericetorum]
MAPEYTSGTSLLETPLDYLISLGTRAEEPEENDAHKIPLNQLSNTVEIVYGPTVFLTKLSILLQYHQIFVPTRAGNKLTFYSIHILIWTNLLLYFIDTFVEAFACTPREMIWNPFVTSGHCLNINANLVATASFNILSDFSIFALPLFVIWKLHLPTKEKIGVSAIFAVGLFGCIASIIRLLYTIKFVTAKDSTYTIFFVAVWAVVEIAIGIIVGCLPVLPRFFQHLTHSHTSFDSSRGSGGFNKHSKQSHTSSTSTSSTPAPPQRPTRPFSRSHSRSGTLVLNDFGNEIYEPLHERHVMSTHGYVELKGEGVGKSAGESIAMKELGMMEKEDGGNKGVDMDLEIRKAVRAETEERSIQMV